MSAAISFEGVTKSYRGAVAYRTLRDDVVAGARRLVSPRRTEAPEVRALDDITFDMPVGGSTALIGANGAGKTTALKITSRITYPTEGVVRVRGRVGALLEVGTGMHPELTGRENIQIYGRILGHTGRDIDRRMTEIVDFAEIGAAIDRPVKQYSSGMQLRLGFSVAAHLEPDVFLVDEAISVGDAHFQYRCVERMGELVREGRTLVFVSHDMGAVETLCERAILFRDGKVAADGPARDVIHDYLKEVHEDLLVDDLGEGLTGGDLLEISRVSLHGSGGEEISEVASGDSVTVRLHYRAHVPVERPAFSIGLSDGSRECFTLASMLVDGEVPKVLTGEGHMDCIFTELPLHPRTYQVWGSVRGESGVGYLVDWQQLRRFRVGGGVDSAGKEAVALSMEKAPVKIPYRWRLSG